jgi:hypothetical protein
MRPRAFDQSNFFNLNDVLLRCVLREQLDETQIWTQML